MTDINFSCEEVGSIVVLKKAVVRAMATSAEPII